MIHLNSFSAQNTAMKTTYLILVALFSLSSFATPSADHPRGPDPRLTPGAICTLDQQYRYPERISYCERDVSVELKASIFEAYRKELGYQLSGERSTYKIDHFIPLCAGGSNERTNLWPQHESIFTITDPIEALVCKKLAAARIKQQDAINLIVLVKRDLSQANNITHHLKSL